LISKLVFALAYVCLCFMLLFTLFNVWYMMKLKILVDDENGSVVFILFEDDLCLLNIKDMSVDCFIVKVFTLFVN